MDEMLVLSKLLDIFDELEAAAESDPDATFADLRSTAWEEEIRDGRELLAALRARAKCRQQPQDRIGQTGAVAPQG